MVIASVLGVTTATINYSGKLLSGVSGKGVQTFSVPGPEVGVGAPFLVILVVFALYKMHRTLRYPAA